MGSKSPAFKGRASPLTRDLCNIRVKSQIWIAVTVYVLVAVVKKRLSISADLYTILQVLSLALFEKMPIFKLFSNTGYNLSNVESHNQLILFE